MLCSYCWEDWTPIMMAAKNGHLKIVQYLAENGANVNRQKEVSLIDLTIAVDHATQFYFLSIHCHCLPIIM